MPLFAGPMFRALGFHWACSLLGFFGIAMIAIPFCFIKWGDQLRARSSFRQEIEAAREDNDEVAAAGLFTAAVANEVPGDTATAVNMVAEDQDLAVLLALSEAQRKGGSVRGSLRESTEVGRAVPAPELQVYLHKGQTSQRTLAASVMSAVDRQLDMA